MHEKKDYVLTVGDVNVDLVLHVPSSGFDPKSFTQNPELTGGGSVGNVASALKKLGCDVEFIGTIGNDAWGKSVYDEFNSLGIGVEGLKVDEKANTVCVFAFEDDKGGRIMWPWPNQNQSFRILHEETIDWQKVKNAAWVHTSGMVFSSDTSARKTTTKIIKTAYENGIPTSLDLNLRAENGAMEGGSKNAILEILPYCSYILGSLDEEFSFLRGNESTGDINDAKHFVKDKTAVIARMGKDGSVGLWEKNTENAPSSKIKEVDTIGAGDSYNAGFIVACLKGKPLAEALVWGNASAAYTVAHQGARNTPNLKQLEQMMNL